MLTSGERTALAAELDRAERDRLAIAPIAERYPEIDVVDAYEIQLINITRRLKDGARVV
ncbi:2-keto-4-pentenoate hydratase, partial [Nocardia thailandica]